MGLTKFKYQEFSMCTVCAHTSGVTIASYLSYDGMISQWRLQRMFQYM